MRKMELKKLAASLALVTLLAGCFGSDSMNGDYIVNKERTMSAPTIINGQDLSEPTAFLSRFMVEQTLSKLGKIEVNDKAVKVANMDCELNAANEVICGREKPEGVLTKSEQGIILLMTEDDNRIELHYDLVVKR